jgi:xanthine dehydrogenase accessory factor
MTANELLQLAQELNIAHESYAMVTVVRVTPPNSAAPGAQAIVRSDGSLHGWIGGGCAKPAVVGAALEAIRLGVPKLVRISNQAAAAGAGVELHRMPCASNGEIELFVHPYAAAPLLLVLGTTLVAAAARGFAERVGFRVTDAPGDLPQVALVATQGEGDEEALEAALTGPATRVLLIASARKAAKLREAMLLRGIGEHRLAALEAPAGPDIGATTPEEIALAAVAGAVACWRGATRTSAAQSERTLPAAALSPAKPRAVAAYRNPVCGIVVDPQSARHVVDYEGAKFYFCCDGCKTTFDANPGKYAAIQSNMAIAAMSNA